MPAALAVPAAASPVRRKFGTEARLGGPLGGVWQVVVLLAHNEDLILDHIRRLGHNGTNLQELLSATPAAAALTLGSVGCSQSASP